MGCKLQQLAVAVLLILRYHSEFKTSWHVLSLPLSHARLQIVLGKSQHLDGTRLTCAMQENITVMHEETQAGIVKMETNLAEIPKNQHIQSFADVGWFVPSRVYCFQCHYLSVCSAVGVGSTRAGHHLGSWPPWDHAAATELSSCPKRPLRPAAAPFGADMSQVTWQVIEGEER